jgi:Dehydrogenases with different specificities (related to short-chain alcohol dehydrogenases)
VRVFLAGGSGGIGSATCRKLAKRGWDVALTYRRNKQAAEQVADEVVAEGRRCLIGRVDLVSFGEVKQFADTVISGFGGLDAVVYAAGPHLRMRHINAISPIEWATTVNSDINGCFNVVAATLPHFREVGGGAYVAVVTGAVDTAAPRDVMSAAPKAAIQSLMRGLAAEEGRNNIRANCVGPGWIDTPLSRDALETIGPESAERWLRAVPLRRFGKVDDVAHAIAFLLSPEAGYITGETISVAGGLQI